MRPGYPHQDAETSWLRQALQPVTCPILDMSEALNCSALYANHKCRFLLSLLNNFHGWLLLLHDAHHRHSLYDVRPQLPRHSHQRHVNVILRLPLRHCQELISGPSFNTLGRSPSTITTTNRRSCSNRSCWSLWLIVSIFLAFRDGLGILASLQNLDCTNSAYNHFVLGHSFVL